MPQKTFLNEVKNNSLTSRRWFLNFSQTLSLLLAVFSLTNVSRGIVSLSYLGNGMVYVLFSIASFSVGIAAAALVYSILKIPGNTRQHLLVGSAIPISLAFRYISSGLIFNPALLNLVDKMLFLILSGIPAIFTISAGVVLLCLGLLLISGDNPFLSNKLYYSIISFSFIRIFKTTYNMAIKPIILFNFYPSFLTDVPWYALAGNMFYVLAYLSMILAVMRILKSRSYLEWGEDVLRPVRAIFLFYGVAGFIYMFGWSNLSLDPLSLYFLALSAISLLSLIYVATYLLRLKTLKLSFLATKNLIARAV